MVKKDIKKSLILVLRKIRLLQLVDYMMLLISIIKNKKSNVHFLSEHPSFVAPPYSLAYDAYNHTNWELYYEMGNIHSQLISMLIQEYIKEKEIKIFEWGCGPARVIQHLLKLNNFEKVELFASDYNRKSINWCRNSFSNINFSTNDIEPPLSFQNESFDCIYAISIFTHLSEKNHYLWLKELLRVLKPNGILIFTTHGDLCANRLLHNDKEKYQAGNIVVKDKIQEGKKHFLAY